jgi:hypothetical protein
MIDRRIEKINNSIALEIGLNSECIYFDEYSGIKISRFIKNSKNIALTDPCETSNLIAVSGALKKFIRVAKAFRTSLNGEKN